MSQSWPIVDEPHWHIGHRQVFQIIRMRSYVGHNVRVQALKKNHGRSQEG